MIFIKSLEYIYYSNIEIIKNKQGSQTPPLHADLMVGLRP